MRIFCSHALVTLVFAGDGELTAELKLSGSSPGWFTASSHRALVLPSTARCWGQAQPWLAWAFGQSGYLLTALVYSVSCRKKVGQI